MSHREPGLVAFQEGMAAVPASLEGEAQPGKELPPRHGFWDVLAQMCPGRSSGRLCSAAGQAPLGLPRLLPCPAPRPSRGSTGAAADGEAASLFPVIWSSCGAPGQWHCSSEPSFAPEANWDESKGLSGFLSRFPPCLVGLITPKGVRVNYSSGLKRSEKTLCHPLFEFMRRCCLLTFRGVTEVPSVTLLFEGHTKAPLS